MRWLFIGAGNMASSLIGGLLNGGTDKHHVAVIDPDDQARTRAQQQFGVLGNDDVQSGIQALYASNGVPRETLSNDTSDRVSSPLVVVIAVKPHIVEPVCRALCATVATSSHTPADIVYVSVAAGVQSRDIQAWLPDNAALVRCMPNTPALLGLGVTALFANEFCNKASRQRAQTLLDNAGKTLWFEDEASLDAVTAVSGSGPAYFFYLIEHMIEAGVSLGLTRDTAQTLAIETAFGAASMAREQTHSPSTLRENVTSKGGTTAAALSVFDQHETPAVIEKAMRAAHDRAQELGDELGGN